MTGREYLFSLELLGIKLGLDQIRALLDALGRPDGAFPAITVAGTNGKGSVTAMIERGARAAGYRTGRYTSPHLVHLEERVAVDGVAIDPALLERLAGRVRTAAARLPAPPTFFEATTALALEAFRDAAVEVAVLEVGLGGRLDATNAVDAPFVAIASVDLDHQEQLGGTVEAIAREKAGVIKRGATVVLGANPQPVRDVVRETCAAQGATLIDASVATSARAAMIDGRMVADISTPGGTYAAMRLALRGRHQVTNAVTALLALEAIDGAGAFRIDVDARRLAVEDAAWPARLELITTGDTQVLIDGAHNPGGARALAEYLAEAYGRPLPIVIGVMRDKHAEGILRALAPVAAAFVCTAAGAARALPPDALADVARHVVPHVAVATSASPAEAIARARGLGSPVVVAGSLYLAGEARAGLA